MGKMVLCSMLFCVFSGLVYGDAIRNIIIEYRQKPLTIGSIIRANLPHRKHNMVTIREIILDSIPRYRFADYNYRYGSYYSELYNNPYSLRNRILEYAYSFLNIPYKFGGNSKHGIDCSAFVMDVFKAFGINLPRTAAEQSQYGRLVYHHLKPGDLLFFKDTYKPGISHVGIYIGNGLMIDASSIYGKVVVENVLQPYLIRHFAFAKRIIPTSHKN